MRSRSWNPGRRRPLRPQRKALPRLPSGRDKGVALDAAASGLLISAFVTLVAIFVAAVIAYGIAGRAFRLEPQVSLLATVMLAGIFALAVNSLDAHPHRRFGAANGVTAVRAALTSLFTAIVLAAAPSGHSAALVWFLAGLSLVSLALDGIDGWLARRFAQESAFGARFDMEMDACLILALSIAAVILGKAGFWVLAIGLMRYAFVMLQWFQPRLGAPLPPSFRRKAVCVTQIAALVLIIVPAFPAAIAPPVAALSLAALVFSFAADLRTLLGGR